MAGAETEVGKWTGNPNDVAISFIHGLDKVYLDLQEAQRAAVACSAQHGERCDCKWRPFNPKLAPRL